MMEIPPYCSLQAGSDFPPIIFTQAAPSTWSVTPLSLSTHTQLTCCLLPEPSLACPPEGTGSAIMTTEQSPTLQKCYTVISLDPHATSAGSGEQGEGAGDIP